MNLNKSKKNVPRTLNTGKVNTSTFPQNENLLTGLSCSSPHLS